MRLGQVVVSLGAAALTLGGAAAGAPIAAVAAGAALAGFAIADAREGRRKHFDQDYLKEADKTTLAYREQKRQAAVPGAPPNVSVITAEEWWDPAVALVPEPAAKYCRVYRGVVKNPDAGTTIDARYRSITEHLGGGYYCLETGPQDLRWTDVYGSAQVPSTARFPRRLYETKYPHQQTWDDFRVECQAVVDYCRSIRG